MSESPATKSYFSTSELAAICSVSATTIFRAVVNKTIKASTTPGGHFRISREEAEEFLRKNNVPLPWEKKRTRKILIIEDNPVELRLYQRALAESPRYEVQGTSSGYLAGFLTQSFRPDLILLDIFLPDLDGREVAKAIRADDKLKRIKIVAITAASDPKDVKEIKALGLDGFIQKPISPAHLMKEIQRYLP